MTTAALDLAPVGLGRQRSLFGVVARARLESARDLSDGELAELETNSGMVGLIAKHVRSSRAAAQGIRRR